MTNEQQVGTRGKARGESATALASAGLADLVLLSIRDLQALTSHSESALRNMIRAGTFPAPDYRQGERCVRWTAGVVRQWLEANRVAGAA